MKRDKDIIVSGILSYWNIFRIVFVLFSLYLLGDAFFRWDGFRYYASFAEFIPSIALITILWSILAVIASLPIWLSLIIFEWFCQHVGWKSKIEHSLTFIVIFVLVGAIAWIAKRYMLYQTIIPFLHIMVFFGITLTALSSTWLLRNYAELWINEIQQRITPLVWIFIILTVLSVPVVAYHTLGQTNDIIISQENARSDKSKEGRPNIILVTFDALTSRNMSLYGYHRETTPFISNWAKNASVFTRAEAESVITTPTTASLMTGKRL